jgi:hypothetical protein
LTTILASVRPYTDRSQTLGRIPLAILVHACRLWGRESRFPAIRDGRGLRGALSGEEMCRTLLHHAGFAQNCEVRSPALLIRSTYGVRVLNSGDGSFVSEELMTHFGKLTQVMSEVGMPAGAEVTTSDGYVGTLREIIQDDAARLVSGAELEFSTAGLSRYAVDGRPWSNRFGQEYSFEYLARLLLERKPGSGVCGGCHSPHALTVLLRADQERNLLTRRTREEIRAHLKMLASALERCQTGEGGWDRRWPAHCEPRGYLGEEPRSPLQDALMTTGHHLEWIALAPEDCRPSETSIRAAVRYLVRLWPEVVASFEEDWHLYPAATHAARAVWLVSGLERCRIDAAGKR